MSLPFMSLAASCFIITMVLVARATDPDRSTIRMTTTRTTATTWPTIPTTASTAPMGPLTSPAMARPPTLPPTK